jgi:PTS system nitrogen regulatory IIA component
MKKLHCFEGGSVVQCLESRNKFDAIRELIKRAPILSYEVNHGQIEEAAINREKIYTTGLGRGIAIAHGKTKGVKKLYIVLGISREGIEFNAIDGKPVNFLFLIANPPEKNSEYLIVLSTLARILRDERFLVALLSQVREELVEQMIHNAFLKCIKNYN